MEKFYKLLTYLRTTVYPSVTIYLLIAYFNWDIAWVAHVDAVMRVTFVLFYVAICCIAAFAYLESKDK